MRPTLTIFALLLAGCADTATLSAEHWQLDQCRRLPDLAERQRCEQSNARSFEEFKKDSEKRSR